MDKGIFYLPVYSTPNQSILIPLSELSFNSQFPTTKLSNKQKMGLITNKKKTKKHKYSESYYEQAEPTTRKPIYIDIEISKLESSQSLANKGKDGTVYYGKEQYLEECIDIYTVLQSRRTHTMPELKEKWSPKKLEKFGRLSDAELIKEGNAKCALPDDVVKQSTNEIKQSVPTKASKLHVKNSVNHQMYRKVSSLIPEMSLQVKTTSTGNFVNIDNTGAATSVVTNEEHSEEHNIQANEQNSNLIGLGVVEHERPPFDWPSYLDSTTTSKRPESWYESLISTTSPTPLLDEGYTIKSLLITNKQKEVTHEIETSNNSKSKKPTDELTGIGDAALYQYYEEATMNYLEDLAINENYFTTEAPTTAPPTTPLNWESAFSSKDKYADLSPLDDITPDSVFLDSVSSSSPSPFTEFPPDKSPFDYYVSGDITSSVTVYQTTTEPSRNILADILSSKLADTDMLQETAVSGKMYFNFGNDYVPARFMQEPSGEISIRIDVNALCDKLNLSTNGSILIGVMCKCAQSEICRS